ncbi:MAG: hypothetical protein CVV64_15625 [Candidatus Wallbacteria bacterium HGW-Wallbacteria-1]|jgi:outer membrane cobalamin receptor|uniref:TonB-dependent receptor plug domain-containing protein n=1 Tax=Candidatus Wallbacteria bacterium HGW-Wallbacteria-1 TaxID=2013854 RepID=A0A2N1PLC8_9BACT|nr:MAG: hypothetical protein CVV64_15625 [Candidatus Wallbacteria bacterium HGW-Wallbacteria-1]
MNGFKISIALIGFFLSVPLFASESEFQDLNISDGKTPVVRNSDPAVARREDFISDGCEPELAAMAGEIVAGDVLPEISIRSVYSDPVRSPLRPSSTLSISTDVVDREEMEAIGARVVTDTIFFRPNVTVYSQGRKYRNMIYVRSETPAVVLDGASSGEDSRSLYTLPSETLDRIEIIRDSSALIYGRPGVGGVVNMTTRPIIDSTMMMIEGGTFATSNLHMNHSVKKENWGFSVDAQRSTTDGPSGMNSAEDTANFALRFQRYLRDDSYLKLNFQYDDIMRQIGNQTAPDTSTWTAAQKKQFAGQMANMSGWSFDPWNTIIANMEYHRNWTARKSTNFNFYRTDRNSTFRTLKGAPSGSDDITDGISVRHTMVSPDGDFTMRTGFQSEHWYCPTGKLYYTGKNDGAERRDYGLFIQGEKKLGSGWTVDAGIRRDHRHVITDSVSWGTNLKAVSDKWEDPVINWAAGIAREWQNVEASFRFGTGILKPMNSSATQDGSILRDEQQKQYNLGFLWKPPSGVRVNLNLFRIEKDDALVDDGTRMISAPGVVPQEWINTFRNDDLKSDGAEIDVQGEISRGLSLSLGYGIRNYSSSTNPSIQDLWPESNWNFGLRCERGRLKTAITTKYVSSFQGSRFLPVGLSLDLGDFVRTDITFDYLVNEDQSGEQRAYLVIQNAGDERYSTIPTYPDNGRKYLFGYKWLWR